jgi:flagellar biosynthetic protein FliP
MSGALRIAFALAALAAPLQAFQAAAAPPGATGQPGQAGQPGEALDALSAAASEVGGTFGGMQSSTAVEIAVLLTVLSLLPAVLITLTSFTRIVIVLSFVRRSLAINELPPNPVITGLALFLTTFVMAPVAGRMHEKAYVPYRAGELTVQEAGSAAWSELSRFLAANTRRSEIEFFADMAHAAPPAEGETPPFRVLVPAFVVSELKTAFQMGFLLFLPFLVIDLVVSSVLLSMGMFMLPPVMVSTPLKILLFVLVDGWHLVCHSLVTSFISA